MGEEKEGARSTCTLSGTLDLRYILGKFDWICDIIWVYIIKLENLCKFLNFNFFDGDSF